MNTDEHGFQHTDTAKPRTIGGLPVGDLNAALETGFLIRAHLCASVVEWISDCVDRAKCETTYRILRVIAIFAVTLLPIDSAFSQFILESGVDLPAFYSGAAAWADYDGDGRMDFLLTGYAGRTEQAGISLWRNTGSGFSNVTASAAVGLSGFADSSAAWGDFDNDGRVDVLVTGMTNSTTRGVASQIWRNTGSGFTNLPIPALLGVKAGTIAVCDFDCDGRLDFMITGTTNEDSGGAVSELWRNTGDGFTNVPIAGLRGFYLGSLAWGDFDNDRRPDFFIAGMASSGGIAAELWRNTGDGFTNVPIPGLDAVAAGSVAWGDFDNDGLLGAMPRPA